MKICYSKQMKSLDEISINTFGIPGSVLMENAGVSVAREIETLQMQHKTAVIVCGTGNNGGDGFVIARHLHNSGWLVCVMLCGKEDKIKGDALLNLNILKKMEVPIYAIDENTVHSIQAQIKECSLVVDALLGTGFSGKLSEIYKTIITYINNSEKYIVSVDIPSGLDADSGFAELCVTADTTVTFQLAKVGMVINDGPKFCGKLIVSDISIPKKAIEEAQIDLNIIDMPMIRARIKKRELNTHKGTYGKSFIVACSQGMTGAGVMAARSAIRSGSGTVVLGVPKSLQNTLNSNIMEVMTKGLSDDDSGWLKSSCIGELDELMYTADSILTGPGLSNKAEIQDIISYIIKNSKVPLVIDADGLNAIAQEPEILKQKQCEIILTPHPGEMARLTGNTISEIQRNRIHFAEKFAKEYKVIVVLKGFRTIIATPDGAIYINPKGNPGMATAGAGDVLAGIITGFAAQNLNIVDAAICGVYIHGMAGDIAAEKIGEYGLAAGDIIEYISHTIKNITQK